MAFYRIEYGAGCSFLPDYVDFVSCEYGELLDAIDSNGDYYPSDSLAETVANGFLRYLDIGESYRLASARCTVFRISESEYDSAMSDSALFDY